MMDEEEQRRKIQMQKELFSKVKGGAGNSGQSYEGSYEDDEDVDDGDDLFHDFDEHHGGHPHQHRETEEEKQASERFFMSLTGEDGEERDFTSQRELMDEAVEFIMARPEHRLTRYL